jgi:glycosyltransferase involved in cell wall biosynthesis
MDKRITVLISMTDLDRHGVQHQVLELVKGLDKERFRPVVLTLSPGGPMEREYRAILGDSLISLERKGKYDFLCLFKVCRILRRMKVDVVQPFITPATFFTLLPALLCHTPVKIVTERNSLMEKDYGGFGFNLYMRVENLLSRFADWAVANSGAGKEYLIGRGIKPSRTKVIYNGIDTSHLTCDSEAVAQVRQRLDLTPASKVVGMVARMFPAKRHDIFLQAAAMVNHVMPDTRFVLLGDGVLRSYLEKLSQELGLASKAIFFGEQRDVAPYLSTFDVFALSSDTEGLSLSVCEAMAMAKPVVATDVGGNRELVEEGKTGFLVPPRNPEALSKAIIRVLQNPDMAQSMGKTAREKVATQLGLERYLDEYQSLYEETLMRKNRRRKSVSAILPGSTVN